MGQGAPTETRGGRASVRLAARRLVLALGSAAAESCRTSRGRVRTTGAPAPLLCPPPPLTRRPRGHAAAPLLPSSPGKFLSASLPLTRGKLPKSAQCGSGIHTGLSECVPLLSQERSTINVLTLCARDGTVAGEGARRLALHPGGRPLCCSAARVPSDSLGPEYRGVSFITMETAHDGE